MQIGMYVDKMLLSELSGNVIGKRLYFCKIVSTSLCQIFALLGL